MRMKLVAGICLFIAAALWATAGPCASGTAGETPGGTIMRDPDGTARALSPAQQALIPIAAFTANGDTTRLAAALEQGLDAGLSISAIREVLLQMYAYTGFPRSLTGLNTFTRVLKAREDRGIRDAPGPEPARLPPAADKRAIGAKIQTELVGRPVAGPVYEFAPAIDTFLKEHLFCDIFSRGVLSNQERELATVSALAALPAETQLASHLRVCLNTGLTPEQLRAYVAVLAERVGTPQAQLASRLVETMLEKQH